ncbi:MAG TPA: methyltransferase domain-containing protein [Acidimicrobiales bacterium]|nr:methyltransferase domain-containing protein [Acidimicrobiales bacterium]
MDLVERQAAVVGRHPWELARARFFVRLLDRLGLLRTTGSWLDVGSGDAWFASQLRAVLDPGARVVCWDTNYSDAELAGGAVGLELTAERPSGRFDGILMLDVIEHTEDDVGFVRDVVEGSLSEGGWVLASVPSYQALFSEHDRALRHHRRYSPRALRGVLEAAGLTVEACGGLFHGLLAVRAVQVLRERRRGPSGDPAGIGHWEGAPSRTRMLTRMLEAEGRVSLAAGVHRLPVVPGLSTWAYCRAVGRLGAQGLP